MNRLALGLVIALLLSSCSFGEGSKPDGANDAEAFKKKMDAQARELLPALHEALGGATLNGMQAHFYEKGGSFGVWSYTADGVFEGPFEDGQDVLGISQSVLEEQGYTVALDSNGTDISARKDGVLVVIDEVPAPDGAGVARVSITMVSDDGLSSRDDFAEDSADEDYAAYAK